ncbi:MAG TPA: hypothetical protein PKU97_18360 [Kofleriaceae bacterium]|nr:hypothetical protein [Kofleriaceae bacterium]
MTTTSSIVVPRSRLGACSALARAWRMHVIAIAAVGAMSAAACTDQTLPLQQQDSQLWTLGATSLEFGWNSGKTANLSNWRELTCYSTYGERYLLTSLQVWREPSGNLDNFIARLKARCTEYVPYDGDALEQDDSTEVTNLLYEGEYRSDNGTTRVSVDRQFAGGLLLNLNPVGHDYVRDVMLSRLHKSSVGNFLEEAPWGDQIHMALGNAGAIIPGSAQNYAYLGCPEQFVVTGLALRYDQSNGKIRNIKIYCRSLTHS